MNEQKITIRRAESHDITAIFALVQELAVYEKSKDKVTATIKIFEDSLKMKHFEGFVAESESEIVGIALFYIRFSTWKGPILFLEDFIVNQKFRRLGIGKMLFESFVNEAKDRNYPMCMWQVLDWNEPAISFYNKYAVVYEDNWLDVKLYFPS